MSNSVKLTCETVNVYKHVVTRVRTMERSAAGNLLMDFGGCFRSDGLSQNLRETGGFRRRKLGVVEGRKPRSVRISSSEVDLELKTSRD